MNRLIADMRESFLLFFFLNFLFSIFFHLLLLLPFHVVVAACANRPSTVLPFSIPPPAEMRDGPGPDVAPGPLFLRPVRLPIQRGGLPGEGRQGVLQERLPLPLRPQMQGLLHGHHRGLHLGLIRPVARRLLRLSGKWRLITNLLLLLLLPPPPHLLHPTTATNQSSRGIWSCPPAVSLATACDTIMAISAPR